jgi:branched-chain amino acid transport system ATP-binding protein
VKILEVSNVTKQFSGLTALNDVSISVEEGEIRGLIGPNGAGKSTLFKNISGFQDPTRGQIIFDGQDITGKKPHDIASLGAVSTFQECTLFEDLTVLEHLLVGCHIRAKSNIFEAMLGSFSDKYIKKQIQAMDRALEVMDFVGLSDRKDQHASELPLGSQRALSIAIAVCANPKILLMDEPFAGMNIDETMQMVELTRKIRDSGVTILIVEHDMKAVMELCESLSVLNFGTLLAEGSCDEIRQNEEVINAYLGSMNK